MSGKWDHLPEEARNAIAVYEKATLEHPERAEHWRGQIAMVLNLYPAPPPVFRRSSN